MALHELKTDPEVFQQSWEGSKVWEIRYNDRDFALYDTLILNETQYSGAEMRGGRPLIYTRRRIFTAVVGIVEGYGLMPGWCILSVKILKRVDGGIKS